MPLPESFRWADSADGGSNLYLRYGSIASIKPDGTMKLKYWQKEFHAKAASVAQAKRFIERWILARNTARAYECVRWRARYSRATSPSTSTRLAGASHIVTQQSRPEREVPSPRIIKVEKFLPDDFESIADVGEPLQTFAAIADHPKVRSRRNLVMPSVG